MADIGPGQGARDGDVVEHDGVKYEAVSLERIRELAAHSGEKVVAAMEAAGVPRHVIPPALLYLAVYDFRSNHGELSELLHLVGEVWVGAGFVLRDKALRDLTEKLALMTMPAKEA